MVMMMQTIHLEGAWWKDQPECFYLLFF